ncbi:hypothetical protein [Deinococcus radiophilus]|uniref:hypothetical protein n=1 Tax=Deinococcus radiophilus TaxID=32062 RepID=UPI0036072CF7
MFQVPTAHQPLHLSPALSRSTLLGVLTLLLMACSPQPEASTTPASNDTTTATSAETDASGTEAAELRLGVFPNVTHTAGLVGIHEGTFQKSLGARP